MLLTYQHDMTLTEEIVIELRISSFIYLLIYYNFVFHWFFAIYDYSIECRTTRTETSESKSARKRALQVVSALWQIRPYANPALYQMEKNN